MMDDPEFRRIIEDSAREFLQTVAAQHFGGYRGVKVIEDLLTRAALPILMRAERYESEEASAVLDFVVRNLLRMAAVVTVETLIRRETGEEP